MARLSKDCPKCGEKRPVTLELVPGSPTVPSAAIRYRVTCRACGYEYPPDGPTIQTVEEIRAFLAPLRADAKAAKVAFLAVVPLGPRGL